MKTKGYDLFMIWKAGRLMIRYVTKNDEDPILSLMELVKDDFAGYKEEEFLEAVYNCICEYKYIIYLSLELCYAIIYSKCKHGRAFLTILIL